MASAEIRVEVVHAAGPHRVKRRELDLPLGATAAQAVQASGLLADCPAEQVKALQLGCWGCPCGGDRVLRDRDRVELTRPLVVDPKEARRLRYQRDGMKRTLRPPRS